MFFFIGRGGICWPVIPDWVGVYISTLTIGQLSHPDEDKNVSQLLYCLPAAKPTPWRLQRNRAQVFVGDALLLCFGCTIILKRYSRV